ncbi:hypothetical protein M885DRAFT_548192 [Pelagophyceae sp. CCMP2097]|nr:hypothetical protein M885DRAFT_548192 [Pelagophyceae sp. CCMP2097]
MASEARLRMAHAVVAEHSEHCRRDESSVWHPSLQLAQREARGLCVVVGGDAATIRRREVLARVPLARTFRAAPDESLAATGTDFGDLVLCLLRRLARPDTAYLRLLRETMADFDDDAAASSGGDDAPTGTLARALARERRVHISTFSAHVLPRLRLGAGADAVDAAGSAAPAWAATAAQDAQAYLACRRLVESRGFELRLGGRPVRALVPAADLFNHAIAANAAHRPCADGACELVALREIPPGVECCWDYQPGAAPLEMLHQYGFFDAASAAAAERHSVTVALRRGGAGWQALGRAVSADATRLERRRAAGARAGADAGRSPTERCFVEPTESAFWVDCGRGALEAPLLAALRAALASEDDVRRRDTTFDAWSVRLGDADAEILVLGAMADVVRETLRDVETNVDTSTSSHLEYSRTHLSRLIDHLDEHAASLHSDGAESRGP